MAVYITAGILSVLFASISDYIKKSQTFSVYNRKYLAGLFAFISFLPLTLISAVRYNVGSDFIPYKNIYESGSYKRYEIGFAALTELLHLFSNDSKIFFFITSVFICAGYYIAIYRESASPVLSTFMLFSPFCFFASLSLIRQQMATVLLLNALSMYRRNKKKSAVCLSVLAFSFHYSSIFFTVFFLLLSQIKLNRLRVLVLILLPAILVRLLEQKIREFITSYTSYGRYYNNNEPTVFLSCFLVLICFLALLLYEFDRISCSKELKVMLVAIIIGVTMGLSVSVFFSPANRMMYYSDAVLVLYVPETINQISNRSNRKIMRFLIISGYIFRTLYYFRSSFFTAFYLPYSTFWEV